jgi:hypothetical protein
MSSDINVQTFSGKVNITSNLLVGDSHLFVDTINNRVGLVTNTPAAGLHVNSNAYVHTNFRVGSGIVMNETSGLITAGSFVGDGSGLDHILNNISVGATATSGTSVGVTVTDKPLGAGVDLGFTIPVGADGAAGHTISSVSASTGAVGVTMTGDTAKSLAFTIPAGAVGAAGHTISSVSASTGAVGVSMTGTTAKSLAFTIPAGDQGIQGETGTFDSSSSFTCTGIDVVTSDSSISRIALYGASQGTGQVFVGQSEQYGGGIEYNGNNDPVETGAGSDYITLYRVNNYTYDWTARNKYNSNDWEFVGAITAGDNVTAYSDIRGKENIKRIENPLERIEKMNGYIYNKKDKPNKKYTGVVAQEVLEVLPEVVEGTEKDGYSVAYGNFAGIFIEAIKELKAQLQVEKVRNDTLETLMATCNSRLENVETKCNVPHENQIYRPV